MFLLFGEESVEVGGRIGDLLSFDLLLVGDLVTGCFISRVVGVIAVFSSLSVFSNRLCVWADDSSLFSARSTDLVDVSVALMVSREALIFFMNLSHSPGSSWINVLTIVSNLLYGDLLGLYGDLLRLVWRFVRLVWRFVTGFIVRNIISLFYS